MNAHWQDCAPAALFDSHCLKSKNQSSKIHIEYGGETLHLDFSK